MTPSIAFAVRCPSCGRPIDAQDVAVLDRRSGEWLLNVMCYACRSRGLIVLEEPTDSADVEDGRRPLSRFHVDVRARLGE
jgi:hypothetical protein